MREVRSASVALVAAIAIVSACASGASGGALPDLRGYELVSPPEKNAGDVMAHPARTRAAVDGDAVVFSSLTSFGDAHGMNIVAEYVSQRDAKIGTNGWATHAILPKLDPFSVNNVSVAGYNTTYEGEFADDLSRGILRTGTNLSGDPNLGTIANLYLRTDMLSLGTGSYLTVTSCAICVSPFTRDQQSGFAGFADATPDFGQIIFESSLNLVPEASGDSVKLYEWDHGTVRLAGILPSALGGGMAPTSVAGTGARAISNYTLRTISDDGRRIFFTDNSSSFGFGRSGDLYMRLDHASTVRIDASERTECLGQDPCPGSASSRFETASADGTKAFFTSSESLTDSDTNAGPDLYMYDSTLPDEDPHNLTLISLDSKGSDLPGLTTGVLGASADGSYVYFFHGSQLVPEGPAVDGHDGLYVWHDGALRYIDTLVGGSFDQEPNSLGTSYGLSLLRSRVSPDGRHLLFSVQPDGPAALYLYEYGIESPTCVSCDPNDASAITDAAFTMRTAVGASQPTSHLNHALSEDGRYVFFTTRDRLVREDQNGKLDVYEYDSAARQTHLLSTGTDASDSFFLDASADGRDVFFVTRERLLGWDKDAAYDLYDARVGGGLPEPPPTPSECGDDACQGALAGAPGAVKPLTSGFFKGNDNVRSAHKPKAKKCARGKVRKRVHGRIRCVKRRHTAQRTGRGQR